jgi:hypothetical protein
VEKYNKHLFMVIGELIRKEENVQRLETKREFKLIELC